ncbi:hypothetical protein KVV02_008482 [Mortierella alpina]|uniref:Vesicular-fusion protein SEC18 n=1 Tax=Mortierella alpina TaxID=64518 RepID=A0A9P8A781_MORAP|nr:hypothetical protein KVV02_008482 [Mortierella alpina]
MSNYPNDRGYNTSQGGPPPPRMPLRPSNSGNPSYQPQSSYSPAPSYSNQSTYGQPAPRQSQHQPFQPQPSRRMRAAKSSHESYALTNYVVANSQDFPSSTHYILVDHQFVFSIKFEDTFQPGCLGFSNLQRKWINAALNKEIDVQPFDPSMDGPDAYLSNIEIEVSLMVKNAEFRGEFDAKEMSRHFVTIFNNQVLAIEQALVLEFQDVRLILVPKQVELVSSDVLMNGLRGPDGHELPSRTGFRGVLTQQTQVQFVRAQDSNIKLRGAARNKPAALENNLLATDVDLVELAALTKNFTGAEINGLVKSATSFAFNRHVKVGTLAGTTGDLENMKIQRADFMGALNEVHAAFGSSDEEFDSCITNGIIHFSAQIEKILREGTLRVEQVQHSERTPLVSLLLHGPPGAGKTALAATMAMESQFPFIKLISPESMIGMNELQKVNAIHRVFQDSYKSPLSVIVMDDIERLLDYTPIGSRFSNTVLQALAVLLKKQPPKGRRLLVLTTTTRRHVLEEMDLMDSFSSELYIENLRTLEEVNIVVKNLKLFNSDEDRRTAMATLAKSGIEAKLSISIKKLLMTIEKARQDSDLVGRFVSDMSIF